MRFTWEFWIIFAGILFLGVSVLHLITCFKRYPKMRGITKILLMPTLCALYLVSAAEIRLFVVAAIVFGWIGDVFLLFKGRKINMLQGVCAFALGHICYIVSMLSVYRHPLNLKILIPIALCAIWMTFVCIKLLPYAPKSLKKPGFLYALLLSGTCLSALYQFLFTGKDAFLIAFIGGLFFMLSDTLLTGQQYRKELKHGNFYVMLTYIIAQALLVLGLAQTGGIRIWNLPL